MPRLILTAITLIAGSAFAQTADFETANRQLNELSYAKACDTFTAYLKAAGDAAAGREAVVKKVVACANAGRDAFPSIEKLGSSGPKDFARAYAADPGDLEEDVIARPSVLAAGRAPIGDPIQPRKEASP